MDSAGAIDSLRKAIWDRLREEGCHGRVPEGALGVVWEPFLDLQGSKNDALKRYLHDFFETMVKNGPSIGLFQFFQKIIQILYCFENRRSGNVCC